ncbi:DUF4194 domain-containing protein [Bacillus pumilus]|uniref:DUF4194 domain-containing protein n=1 Tax=Bacillus pumilus TaxID=1408 RepID=UPI001642AB68|nr:DUF4194 domain-containing protein [Bacillus pumilus]
MNKEKDWYWRYNEELSESDKEQFTRIVGLLLNQTFVLKDKFNPKTQGIQTNRDFQFIAYRYPIIKEYLKIGGWELIGDEEYDFFTVKHYLGSHRKIIKKLNTYFIFVLRLIYEEEREKLRLNHHVITTISNINKQLEVFNLLEKKLNKTNINEVLTLLKHYQIIEKLDGNEINDETRIVIYPTILHIVDIAKLQLITDIFDKIMLEKEEGKDEDTEPIVHS